MLNKVQRPFLQFLLTAVGIFMIGSLPYLVFDDVEGWSKSRDNVLDMKTLDSQV